MDSQQFRRITRPNFSPIVNEETLAKAARKIEVPGKETAQTEDMRYPGYASLMEDGRLVTDYKTHCATNVVASKYGNSMRQWLQHNSSAFIDVSRKRQAERSGAEFYMANTVLGEKYFQHCNEYDCTFSASGVKQNIGLGRVENVPELFGTFSQPTRVSPKSKISLTTEYLGGRNTPHGRQFVPLGMASFNPRNSGYGSSG